MDLLLAFDPENLRADFAMAGADLAADNGLTTATVISLFSDHLASEDDDIPDKPPSGAGDRRGWWGDRPIGGDAPAGKVDYIGSRLWLLAREKQTEQTRQKAIGYCREALQWMIDDGVAARIDVVGQWQELGFLALQITIYDRNGKVIHTFDAQWSATLGVKVS